MLGLPSLIMEYASGLPEGTLLCPNALLHLGTRAAVGQALSRQARRIGNVADGDAGVDGRSHKQDDRR